MKALLQRHKKKKEEKDKKKKGALSSPSSQDESEEITRMASFSTVERSLLVSHRVALAKIELTILSEFPALISSFYFLHIRL